MAKQAYAPAPRTNVGDMAAKIRGVHKALETLVEMMAHREGAGASP